MNILDKTRLLQTSILAGLMMGAAPVYAQTDGAVEQFEEEDQVIVTGSRIRRPDIDSVFPTTVVSAQTLEDRAFTNIADALTEIPAFGGGIDPNGNQGANIGANFVDFLDLGTQRTLTVVNGRRFVSNDVAGNGLAVDFNIIPIALVERIETIGVGGAPVYGADAIAGTVNVILKDDFEGLEATALYGETERGDTERTQYQIVAGANSADGRGNVTFSVEYTNDQGLALLDRPEIFTDDPFTSEVPVGTAGFTDLDPDGDGDFDGVFRPFNVQGGNGQNVQLFTNGGTISPTATFLPSAGIGAIGGQFLQFADNGDLVDFAAGTTIPGQSVFFAQGGNSFDFFDEVGQIRSPVERVNFGSTVKYDINDFVTFKGDVQIANTESDELANQGGFQTFAFGGLSGALNLPASNPFLNDQAVGVLAAGGIGPDDTFFLQRFNNDIVSAGARGAESFVWRISGGLEGDFEAAGREFYYDFHGVAGQSTNETNTQPIINNTRFLNAVEAVVVTDAEAANIIAGGGFVDAGNIACQVTRDFFNGVDPTTLRGVASGSGVTNDDPVDVTACAPLNLFGNGAGSAEALQFVVQDGLLSNDIEQRIWSANFGGQLYELPGGWASFNVGYESRIESATFATGGAVEVGLGRGAAVPETGGRFSNDEIYGEVYLPIISPDLSIPFVDTLEAEGSIREISSTLEGGDATVWTVGGTYKPVADIAIKGNRTRSVRTPSLTELFSPVLTNFEFADDPCDTRFIGDDIDGQDGVRAANCAAVGITGPFTSNVVNATAQGTSGGNPDLFVETANAWTLGAVVQPRWVPGLTVQVDYINIEIEDLIGVRSLEQNLEACFDQADFDINSVVCQSFQRDAANQVVDFQSGQTNADIAEFQFLNIRADYNFDVADALSLFGQGGSSDLGSVGLDFTAFHAIERNTIVDNVPLDNTIGGFTDPRWSGTADVTYTNDGFRFFWRTLWQDRTLFSPSGNNFLADLNDNFISSVGGRFIHNASVSYDLSNLTSNYDKPLIVQLNVDNVLDRGVNTDDGLREIFGNFNNSEVLGRTFTFRVRASF